MVSPDRIAPDILRAAQALAAFAGTDLTGRIGVLEGGFAGVTSESLRTVLNESQVTHELPSSAYVMKRVAGHINVVIHAIGIFFCLPYILGAGERVSGLDPI